MRRAALVPLLAALLLAGSPPASARHDGDTTAARTVPAAIAGLRGPAAASVVAQPAPTDPQAFAHGGPGRLAILLGDGDPGTWLGLVEGLRALGVPLTVTRDWREALRHRMVILYPAVSGRSFSGEAFAALRDFPSHGGTLVAFDVVGQLLAGTFGVGEVQPARSRFSLRFETARPVPRETLLPLGNPAHPENGLWTFSYPAAGATVLARFENGDPAVLDMPSGNGHAYLVGVDAGDLALRGYNNRQQGIARAYVNQYEPAADLLMHWLKDRYREAEPQAVTLAGTPEGRALPVLISHDLDYRLSLRNALDYVAFEREAGIRATYFVQTKYVRDWEDTAFLDSAGLGFIRAIARAGMEIASHSVAHSKVFDRMDQGSGEESFPGYRPVVPERFVCTGCSVMGELRISRFLLGEITGQAPVSFRAGHLLNPTMLPESLLATGYRFGSDATANDLLTHLPVHTHLSRGSTTELPVWEFPVTIEDEEAPPLGERVGAALAVAEDVIRDEGIFVVLIHPNITGHKLHFERELVHALRERAWFGTVSEFGAWWSARDQVELDIVPAEGPDGTLHVHLQAPQPVAGLTLQLPPGYHPAAGSPVASVSPGLAVLDSWQGELDLTLERDPRPGAD